MRGTVLDNGRCPDVVSAYSASDRATLATEMCEVKSNEIKAVPKLIDKLDVDFGNCVITADAMACQKNIVDKIREKGGHFLIEVKGNQKTLRLNIEDNVLKSKYIDNPLVNRVHALGLGYGLPSRPGVNEIAVGKSCSCICSVLL